MLLHQVRILPSKSSLESELRVFERVFQPLTSNQVHATPAPNTSQPPRGLFGICGSSEPTYGHFGIRVFAEPTPGPSGSHRFLVQSSNLPMYEGKRTLDDVTAFLLAWVQHFNNAAQAIGWVGTTGWGEHAVLQLKRDTAVWAMHCFPMTAPIKWSTVCTELKARYLASNALDLVKREWEELNRNKRERFPELNEHFHRFSSKLDSHQAMPASMLAQPYGYKIEKGNEGLYEDMICYIGMRNRTPTFNQRIEHLAALDTSLNNSQSGSGLNTTTTTKASGKKMDSKKVVQLPQLAQPKTTA